MSRVKLTIATTDYDHFRDFRLGLVNAEGIDHTWLTLGHHEVFARFTFNREWDVSELSFAKFCAQVTRAESDIIGLPVACSRLFRFSSFYVNKNSGIKTAADLKGKTIGSPEWAHTAAVYMRGWLADEHGIGLKDVHWYQAGANEAGRIEKVELNIPSGVRLTRVNDRSLSEMIASGEIDCALIARPPNSFLQGHPDVLRLFPNYLEMEEAYYRRTKVWPIMHIIAIQKRVIDEHPWIARNLYNAFLESKRRSLERLLDPAVSRYPLAWLPTYARKMRDFFDGDPFPYGIEENRPTLEQFYARAGHRPSPRQARGDFPERNHDLSADMTGIGGSSTRYALRTATMRWCPHVLFQGRRLRTSHLPRAARQASPCSQDSLPSFT
jgi:4,5-dihydroxyphthalate decarboxylase